MHGRFFLGLAILTTAISIGCGGGRGANRNLAAGQLAVSPTTLDFGKVQVGSHSGKTGTLTAGESSIRVTSADWSGEGFSVSGIVFPLTIAAGQSIPFKVTFAPHRAGSSAGKISFESNAENPTQAAFSGNGTRTAGHSVTLSWRPAESAVGYNIYRGLGSTGAYAKMNTSPHPDPTFTDASVQGGQTYFYTTTAVNKHGKESKHSNQVEVTVPNS